MSMKKQSVVGRLINVAQSGGHMREQHSILYSWLLMNDIGITIYFPILEHGIRIFNNIVSLKEEYICAQNTRQDMTRIYL